MNKISITMAITLIAAFALSACGGTSQSISTNVEEIQVQFASQTVQTPSNGVLNICGLIYNPATELHTTGKICEGGLVDLNGGQMAMLTVGSLVLPFPQSVSTQLVSSGTNISLLTATGEAIATVAAASAIAAVSYTSYESSPCAPEELIGQLMAANPNGKFRPCGKLAPEDKLPAKDPNHHTCHDDTPANPDAQSRWQRVRNTFGNWGSQIQNWSQRAMNIGEFRCSQTTLDGLIIRFAIQESYKITASNTFSNQVVFDSLGRQITSFTDARFKDLVSPAKDLVEKYPGRVGTETINCYDIVAHGITIQPTPTIVSNDASFEASCTAP